MRPLQHNRTLLKYNVIFFCNRKCTQNGTLLQSQIDVRSVVVTCTIYSKSQVLLLKTISYQINYSCFNQWLITFLLFLFLFCLPISGSNTCEEPTHGRISFAFGFWYWLKSYYLTFPYIWVHFYLKTPKCE
jgi:hypothetical protein